eukprot:scaffold1034_cov418-Prasinococcus_capsulatus_cf.AAC.3
MASVYRPMCQAAVGWLTGPCELTTLSDVPCRTATYTSFATSTLQTMMQRMTSRLWSLHVPNGEASCARSQPHYSKVSMRCMAPSLIANASGSSRESYGSLANT